MTPAELSNEDLIAQWTRVVDAAARTRDRLLQRVEEAGVSGQWFGVLHLLLLAEEHRMPMTRLARDLSMTAGGFTKLADRMGREGLIDRRGSAGDRRVVFATLTIDGLATARRGETAYVAALRDTVLAAMPPSRLKTVSTAMGKLSDSLKPPVLEDSTSAAEVNVVAIASERVAPARQRNPALPERRRGRSRTATQADG